ncbi:CAP domain-containing protein [Flavobacterium cauense]|nr:CAP domain-containing protein [Flavobacterium cauense]
MVTAWINSPAHKANMEGDYTHFGIAVKTNPEGKLYFTNMFIRK